MKFLVLAVLTLVSSITFSKTYLIEPQVPTESKLWSWGYISYNDASGFGTIRLAPFELQIPLSESKLLPARVIINSRIDGKPKNYKTFIKTSVADIDAGRYNFQLQFLDKNSTDNPDSIREKKLCNFEKAEFWAQCRVQGLVGIKQINYRNDNDKYLSATVVYVAFPMSISLDTGAPELPGGKLTFGISPVINVIDSQKMIDYAGLDAKSGKPLVSIDISIAYQINKNFMLQFGSSVYSHNYDGERKILTELSYRY
ncbi:MAG: hypothetical protein HRU38_24645 [Saccharospirillaceae bacterium]|nr:hypothetical protein [Pseudomonadales bacterium]NRB81810.1 hypothetical protein [Saccharospirillaceae bacterium]